MGLKETLEDLLGRNVDLVTLSGLKSRIRKAVLAEAFRVA
jgi:predicted nucleotidyltransferase